MNKRLRQLSLTLALLVGAPVVHASILVEPFVGYQVGKYKQSNQADRDFKATNYGARLGYQKMGLMGGAEYLTGAGTEDNGSPKASLKPTNLGVFVGYTFPILLRVYAVYGFDSKFDRKVGDVSNTYEGGTSVKLGVGITSLSFVAINAEYITATYTKYNGVKLTNDLTAGSYGLSLSFPLMF